MIVTLAQELFARLENQLSLLAIFRLGLEGRHVVVTDPPFDAESRDCVAIRTWLAVFPEALRKEIAELLKNGILEAVSSRDTRLELKIVGDSEEPRWQPTPRVHLSDGLRLLQTPLTLLLENRRSDRGLLRALATAEDRKRLDAAEKKGWLTAESTGGIAELVERLKEGKENPVQALRWWCLCDRDAGVASGLSPTAKKVDQRRQKICLLIPAKVTADSGSK